MDHLKRCKLKVSHGPSMESTEGVLHEQCMKEDSNILFRCIFGGRMGENDLEKN